MNPVGIEAIVTDLLMVLAAGLLSGLVCKQIGISLLVGYLIVGALMGGGGLGLVSQESHELEYLARAGALLLLFSVGIEFSLEELIRLSRYFFLGGSAQIILVALPLVVVCLLFGMTWQAALLSASAAALSSTVLVFKALAEWGQAASPHGRRAIAILLFQDVALVPLMLLVPLLTGGGAQPSVEVYGILAVKSLLFVAVVILLRRVMAQWLVPLLARLRSVELVVLFALGVLGGACWGSFLLGLPTAVGALAAGLMLSGNRLSKQVDTIVLPFRESFAALFFVTLGTLLQPLAFFQEPLLLAAGLLGMLLLKFLAALFALRLVGLSWRSAAGMGLGLAQLGEFSFLLVAEGAGQGLIRVEDYNRMLFIALGTLILTPQLLKIGLRWTGDLAEDHDEADQPALASGRMQRAMVVGIGPIGRQIASRLETMGVDVCLVDLSPINLYPFAQQGFHTVAGDACDREVLERAGALHSRLAVVCVPKDDVAIQIVRSLREINPTAAILVRCRYQGSIPPAKKSGATGVVSEEAEASGALLALCESVVLRIQTPTSLPGW